jgi:hypothetical protein
MKHTPSAMATAVQKIKHHISPKKISPPSSFITPPLLLQLKIPLSVQSGCNSPGLDFPVWHLENQWMKVLMK